MFKKRKGPTGPAKQEQDAAAAAPEEAGTNNNINKPDSDETVIVHAAKRQALGRATGNLKNPESSNAVKQNQFGGSASSTKWKQGDAGSALVEAAGDIYSVTSEFGISQQLTGKDFATRNIKIDTDINQDQRSIHERNMKIKSALDEGNLDAGIYRGQNARKEYIGKSEGALSKNKITGNMGPVRASTTARSITRFDYWGMSGDGGVCKEYMQTGFCGYGDACIFMHTRIEHTGGWKLDKQWEEEQKKKQEKLQKRMERCRRVDAGEDISTSEDDSDDEKNLTAEDAKLKMPEICATCKKRWADNKSPPIVTNCKHYFCESCAMKNWAKSKKCPECKTPLDGIFNNCEEQWEKWKKRKAERKEERKSALEGGNRRTSGVEELRGKIGIAY